MKKLIVGIGLCFVTVNAHAYGFIMGYALGNMNHHDRNYKEIIVDTNKSNALVCEYRIHYEQCYDPTKSCSDGKCIISPAQYAGNRGYKYFHKRQLENNGSNWYLIMDAWN